MKENHQKLAFREGVQPWDLASFSGRIESYRFIMESSKSKPYSASYDFPSWQWLSAPPGMLAVAVSAHRGGTPNGKEIIKKINFVRVYSPGA